MDIFFQGLIEWFLEFGPRWFRITFTISFVAIAIALLTIGLWWPR